MIFHAFGIQNRAIWNAMQLHARLIGNTGTSVRFLVRCGDEHLVRKSFPHAEIETYGNYVEFLKKIYSARDYQIFTSTYLDTLWLAPLQILLKISVYYWIQGVIPEESYLKHRSIMRKTILSALEKRAIAFSTYQIVVSSEMKRFLESKYALRLNSITVPCSSDLMYKNGEKIPDSFVYVGGMSAWQRFDIMLQMFNRIIGFKHDARLFVATGEQEKARELMGLHLDPANRGKVSIQSIDDRQKMEEFLNTMEYGFLIRDDDPVNNVSSPIKLAEYLSCGVNVIISDAVTSYAPLVHSCGAGIGIETVEDIDALHSFTPSADAALGLYRDQFGESKLVDAYRSIL